MIRDQLNAGLVVFCIIGSAVAGSIYNVKDYGAVLNGVTDDTAAVLQAFAAAGSGDVVYFPAGTAILHSPLVVSNKSITITGEDVSNTRILWTAPGGINISIPMTEQCEISDLQLVAGCAGAGTAIRLVSVNRATRALIARNLKIIHTDGSFWNKSIYLTTGTLSILKDIVFDGVYPLTTHHIHIDGYSNAIQMSNLTGLNSSYAVFWEGTGEGNYLHNSSFSNNDFGFVRYDTVNTEPFYDIMSCTVTSKVCCAWFYNLRNTTLAANNFVLNGTTNAACIRLEGKLSLSVNMIDNVIKNIGSGAGPGIWVTDGAQMNFVDNTVNGFSTGCRIDGGSRLINIGDVFTNVTTQIELGSGVTNIYRR